MSKIHAFAFDSSGNCRVILHTAIPPGNNLVGNSWKSIWIAERRNVTSMAEGTGPGQISAAEKANVIAGDAMEMAANVPSSVVAQGAVAVNAFADAIIVSEKARLAQLYAYYGWTNG